MPKFTYIEFLQINNKIISITFIMKDSFLLFVFFFPLEIFGNAQLTNIWVKIKYFPYSNENRCCLVRKTGPWLYNPTSHAWMWVCLHSDVAVERVRRSLLPGCSDAIHLAKVWHYTLISTLQATAPTLSPRMGLQHQKVGLQKIYSWSNCQNLFLIFTCFCCMNISNHSRLCWHLWQVPAAWLWLSLRRLFY